MPNVILPDPGVPPARRDTHRSRNTRWRSRWDDISLEPLYVYTQPLDAHAAVTL
jgi:hypothetical protein